MVARIFFLLRFTVFGFVLIQSGVSNFDILHAMFQFKEFHMYGLLGVAVGVTFIAVQVSRKLKLKSLLTGEVVTVEQNKPTKDHIIGGLLCGFGWALTGACPGPALAQIGFGTLAGIFTASGIFLGVYIYGALQSKD